MRYLVTGATGFIGGGLARELIKRGHQVVTVARSPGKAGDLAALGVEIHQGDITDKNSLRGPMTGVDGLFHVAGWYKVGARDKSMAYDINVNGTRNVLEVMRDLAIPKGVYTSTLAIYGDTHGAIVDESAPQPRTFEIEYDRTKSLAHFEVALPMMRDGLPLVIVQPGLVYGPGDTSIMRQSFLMYLQRKLPVVSTVAAYTWAHVDDIVEGHILAMDKGVPGETYIIGGEVKSMADALVVAERATGVPVSGMRVGALPLSIVTAIMSAVEKIVPVPETMSSDTLRSINATYTGSNAKARRELGYDPRPLEAGLRQTLTHEMRLLGMVGGEE
ncbi:MAG: NAD-dependent epimerase/dehydratase family protein [Anaerolineae bacterium]|nr:NAD-dependent epimerase/dehydratase family protein [Anaerolineae bacterium]